MREVWLLGNPDLPQDSLPIKIQPLLAKEFPSASFIVVDPLDEWPKVDQLIIIDAVVGLKNIQVFKSLADFSRTPLVTMHDFDLKAELELRAKLGQLPPFVIIGLPLGLSETEAINQLKSILPTFLK